MMLKQKRFKGAAVVALVASVMTCSKTIIYHMLEFISDYKYTKHNDSRTFFVLYLVPNGFWIWVPMYASYVLGKGLTQDEKKEVK